MENNNDELDKNPGGQQDIEIPQDSVLFFFKRRGKKSILVSILKITVLPSLFFGSSSCEESECMLVET